MIALLALFAAGCGRSQRRQQTQADEAASEKPPTPAVAAAVRCTPAPGAPALAVGATNVRREGDEEEGEGEPVTPSGGAVEFARGAAADGTFLLGLLHHKGETQALVAVLDQGGARLLELGRVDQQAEPPHVAAQAGHWLALVTDVGPAGPSLRLVGLSKNGSQIDVRLGPEVRKGKRDPVDADVAVLPSGQGLVVWDRAATPGRSEVVGLAVDAPSLAERAAPLVLTPTDQVALEPRLVASSAGFWLLWLVEAGERADPTALVDAGLLLEPPRVLFVRELDALGRPKGPPTAINPGEPAPLLVDARVLPSGQLLAVHRSAPADRPTDNQPLRLSIVSPGGAILHSPLESPELEGPGAPTVLGRAGVDVSWVPLEDANGTTGVGRISADGALKIVPLSGLGGRIALAGDPGRLLTAELRGIGVELQIQSCATD